MSARGQSIAFFDRCYPCYKGPTHTNGGVCGGGPLAGGRIVAASGENGPQAEIFTPGFHARLLVNVIYDVDTRYEEVNIKAGKVGVLVAKDGAPLRPGQAFADPFPVALGNQMLDA